jgi:hypothetical protein
MFRATYVPAFYRTLHGVAHAEFRARRAAAACRRTLGRPRRAARADVRRAAALPYSAARAAWLRYRLDREARLDPGATPPIVPVLSRQAAGIPSEPPR